MKTFFTILSITFISISAYSATFTSVVTGNWENGATWGNASPGVIGVDWPSSADNATVNHTVTATTVVGVFDLIVNAGGTLNTRNFDFHIYGNHTVNVGGTHNDGRTVFYYNAAKTINITGSLNTIANWQFVSGSRTISVGSSIVKSAGSITIFSGVTLTNAGTFDLRTNMTGSAASSTFTNTGVFAFRATNLLSTGTFNASAVGNTVIFAIYANQNIKTPSAGTFHHLRVSSSFIKTAQANLIINGNLTIDAVCTLNAGGFDLTIGGNWIRDGGVSNLTGTVTFNGSAAQTIGGTTATTFTNMTIANGAGGSVLLGVAASIAATGTFSVTTASSTFNSNGFTFTFLSTAASTARLGSIATGATLSGTTWRFERHIPGTIANWDDLSSPVSGANISDWDAELFMSLSAICPDGMADAFQSVYYYTEPTPVYTAVTSCTEPLTAAKGFEMWIATTLAGYTATTINTNGTPNFGNVAASVSRTGDGNNLIGNPYGGPADWDLIFGDVATTNLDNVFYVFDEIMNGYASWNGAVGTGQLAGGGGAIPAHQGFWVHSTAGAPTLTFKESHKIASGQTFVRTTKNDPPNVIRMKMHSSASGRNSSEAVIHFREDASDLFDPNNDACFLMRSKVKETPKLVSLSSDNRELNINSTDFTTDYKTIPILAQAFVAGSYSIDISFPDNSVQYNCITLEDVAADKSIYIEKESSYTFEAANAGDERKFLLHLRNVSAEECGRIAATVATELDNSYISTEESGVYVNFNLSEVKNINISIYNVMGQQVAETISTEISKGSVKLNLDKTTQVYFIRIQTATEVVTKKVIY